VQNAKHFIICKPKDAGPVCFMEPNRKVGLVRKPKERLLEHMRTNYRKSKNSLSVQKFKPDKGNT